MAKDVPAAFRMLTIAGALLVSGAALARGEVSAPPPTPTAGVSGDLSSQGFVLGAPRAAEEARIPRGTPVEAESLDTIRFPGSLDPSLLPKPAWTRLVFDVEGRLAVVEATWPSGSSDGERLFRAIAEYVTNRAGKPRQRSGSRDAWWVVGQGSIRLFERARKTPEGRSRELALRHERLGAMVLDPAPSTPPAGVDGRPTSMLLEHKSSLTAL